jgi:CRP/FNR family transcriptional regulator
MQTMTNTRNSCNGQITAPPGIIDNLSAEALQDLESMMFSDSYRSNVILFTEQEEPAQVFVVMDGAVKLSINSSDGRRLILRIVKKGEIVGLSSALSGTPYEMTAETLYPSKLAPIRRSDFLNFLLRHPEVYQTITRELGHELAMACEQLRTVVLSNSAPEKLARLLLEWGEQGQTTECGTRFRFALTHGEIGEFIGTSRETVTRTLSSFRSRKLVTFQGSTVTIPNRTALASFARG